MMNRLYAKAYAKVNLSLDICGRRQDGYHLLQSVMQQISLGDDLSLRPGTSGITMEVNRPYIPTDGRNIVIKTAQAFFDYTGLTPSAHFTLHKRIPSGAGLGGGSSDGVTALRLLDRWFETHLSEEQMVEIVAPIGADMPFFVYGHTGLCEGIGERVTPLSPLRKGALLLIKPELSMSTPKMYALTDASPELFHPDTSAMLTAVQNKDLTAVGRAMGNSMQSAGEKLYPPLTKLLDALKTSGALGAMMSGSGSTVFGLYHTVAEAKATALPFVRQKRNVYVVSFI